MAAAKIGPKRRQHKAKLAAGEPPLTQEPSLYCSLCTLRRAKGSAQARPCRMCSALQHSTAEAALTAPLPKHSSLYTLQAQNGTLNQDPERPASCCWRMCMHAPRCLRTRSRHLGQL